MSLALAAAVQHAPLIVQSHLRWDFVWQRPQQVLSRLAATRDVLFVEEPVFAEGNAVPLLQVSLPYERVHRVVPRLPQALQPQPEAATTLVRHLVQELVGPTGRLFARFRDPIQWFYTPLPAPVMLGAFGEIAVVYDCMDELAQFAFAPAELVERERLLLRSADVVFTGGRRLYEAKSRLHDNVHFFGCGVDAEHFARALAADTPLAAPLRTLPRPILGWIGVIDERLDYDLVAYLADRLPNATLAMVGPIVKVDPAALPQRDNIRWLGQQDYAQLPSFLKGFDVALMPFALNKATEYINPTKTLEYMAAGKPIVSTAVPDVVHNFTPVVSIGGSHRSFLEAVQEAVARPDTATLEAGRRRARAASWEGVAAEMNRRMSDAATRRAWRTRADGTVRRVARGGSQPQTRAG
jgi:glycosyltransferase involved in cell wall biosynthesis